MAPLVPTLNIGERALPALSLPIRVPLLTEPAKPTQRDKKTLKRSPDGLEKGDLLPHIVGAIITLITDLVLWPLSTIISQASPDPLGPGLIRPDHHYSWCG
jgi:hypothetical protein